LGKKIKEAQERIVIVVTPELKKSFRMACVREDKTQKKVLTSLIVAWIKRG